MADESTDISILNAAPTVPTEDNDINVFRRKYKEDAKALLNYKDPIPFPFISSVGEGSDKLTVLPSPHVRVFVMGYEISAWLSNATWGGESTPRQLNSPNNITLKCPRDLFTLTHDNVFLNSWNLNDDFKTSEQVKKALYDWKSDKNVYEEKTLLGTWNLTVNTCIFHTSDTVRIFAHIPWTDDDAWLPVFNGYIHNVNISTDMINGIDTIVLDLETIANKLTTARFLNNPYSRQILNQGNTAQRPPSDTVFVEALDPNNTIIKDKSAQKIVNNLTLYKDVINPTLYQSVLTNTTLERIISFLFYGEIDLSYRPELSGANPTLKDMSLPFEEFEYTDSKTKTAEKQEFLQAFSNQTLTNTRPTLGAVINQQQIFNNERISLEERQSSEPLVKNSFEPGGPLWKASSDFNDPLWNKNGSQQKYKSLIWKLQILTHVINATLEKKSTAPKKNLEDASISLTIKDTFINTNVSQSIIDQENKGILGSAVIQRNGFGYKYENFGGKSDSTELTIPINSANDYYTIVGDLTFPDKPEDIGEIIVKIQDGSFTNVKIGKSGRNYECKNNERSFTLTFKAPTNSLEGETQYIDTNTFNFSTIFTDRYSDFLYKRGWGYLDPRLFSYHRVEFPRTGFPDAQLKDLIKSAEQKKQQNNKISPITTIELKTELKKELANQLILYSFLTKNGMGRIGATIEETSLSGLSIPKQGPSQGYTYDGKQIQDTQNYKKYSKIGIPLAAYDEVDNLIELYQSKDWYDESSELFTITDLKDNPEIVFKVQEAQQKFLFQNLTKEEKSKLLFPLEKITANNFELSTPELTSKLRSAKFIDIVGMGIFQLSVPPALSGLKQTLSLVVGPSESNVKRRLKMIVPPKLNLTNNSVVFEEDDSIKNIYSIVKDFHSIGMNQNMLDIIKLIDPSKENELIDLFAKLIDKNSKDLESIKKSIKESVFGGNTRFISPLNNAKSAAGRFADLEKKQYSYDWLNGGLEKLSSRFNPQELSNFSDEGIEPATKETIKNNITIGSATVGGLLTTYAVVGAGAGSFFGPVGLLAGAVGGAVTYYISIVLYEKAKDIAKDLGWTLKDAKLMSFNTQESKIYFQRELSATSNTISLFDIDNKTVEVKQPYLFLDPKKDYLAASVANVFNYQVGPVFTFSTNANSDGPVKIYNIKPNTYTSPIPPSFMAWAVLAYKYYESRTGITSKNLNNIGIIDSISIEKPVVSYIEIEADKDNNPNTPGNEIKITLEFIPIKPKFESDWYDRWTKNKDRDPNSYFSKTYDDIKKNKENQQNLVQKGDQQYIYKYVNSNFKQLCFTPQSGNSKQPFNIFKIIDAYGTLENPTLDQITERSRGSEKYDDKKPPGASNIPPGDPNYDSAKPIIVEHAKNVEFYAPESSVFDIVAPIDGYIQFVDTQPEKGFVQFRSIGSGINSDNTVHEFSYVGKNVKIGTDLKQNITIAELDNLHWDKVKEFGIYKEGERTIKTFLQNAKKEGVKLGGPDNPSVMSESTLKRLTAIQPSAIKDWVDFETTKISASNGDNNLKILFPSLKDKDNKDIFSSSTLGGSKGKIFKELADFNNIFSGQLIEGIDDIHYFTKLKYTKVRDKYQQILTEAERVKIILNEEKKKDGQKLPTLDDSKKSEIPDKLIGYQSIEAYKFARDIYDHVFYFTYGSKPFNNNDGTKIWSLFIYQSWDPLDSKVKFTSNDTDSGINLIVRRDNLEDLQTFIDNLKILINDCNTIINKEGNVSKSAESYLKSIKKLEEWYKTTPENGDNTYGILIDAQIAAIQRNSPSPLDTEITDGLVGFKKGSTIIKGANSVTWSVYKLVTSIENLDPIVLYENKTDSFKNPKLNTGSGFFKVLSPWAWLNDSLGKKDSAEQYNFGNKEIDWAYEEYFMADWHRKCVVGFSNGIPKDSLNNYNSDKEVNNLYADAIDCAKAAKGRLNSWLTYDEVTIIGKNSGWFGIYSPHGKTVTVALRSPKYGWGINGGLEQLVFQTMSYESNTENKAELLTRLLDRLDYHWWINGNGDVIIDFPHYELIPSHYGPKWESFFQLQNLSTTVTYSENFKELSSLYYYKGGYGIVPTPADAQIQQNVSVIFHLPNVMVRNGIIPVVETFQWITDKTRLKKFGLIQLKKKVLNSFIITMSDLPPILYMTPNTPIYMADRDIFGLVASVRFNWTIAENAVTYRLSPQLTAIKQRLNYEQLALEKFSNDKNFKNKVYGVTVANAEKNNGNEEIFKVSYQDFIKPVYDSATKRIEAVSYYTDVSQGKNFYQTDKTKGIIKSNQVLGFTLDQYKGVILDTKEKGSTLDKRGNLSIENDRLKLIQNNYGYIYGNREPILDYTATYSQNQYVLGTKWEVMDNLDPANTYSVLTDHLQGKNIRNTVDILNNLNKTKIITPISGELKKSFNAAAKVLNMTENDMAVLQETGLNPDLSSLPQETQNQINSVPNDGSAVGNQTKDMATYKALSEDFITRLKTAYVNDDAIKKINSNDELNKTIIFSLGHLKAYDTNDINPGLLAACKITGKSGTYPGSKSVESKILIENYTASLAQVIIDNLNQYKNGNLNPSTTNSPDDIKTQIEGDIAALKEWLTANPDKPSQS